MADARTHAWLRAAKSPGVAHALEAIYAMIADQIEARGPSCWASGRCCDFKRSGHLLYTTGLEAAYCIARQEQAPDSHALEAAASQGNCCFQSANVCGVHAIKPSACRIYFCDRSAQDWQNDLSERTVEQIRRLHERERLEYRYAEWNALLQMFV